MHTYIHTYTHTDGAKAATAAAVAADGKSEATIKDHSNDTHPAPKPQQLLPLLPLPGDQVGDCTRIPAGTASRTSMPSPQSPNLGWALSLHYVVAEFISIRKCTLSVLREGSILSQQV